MLESSALANLNNDNVEDNNNNKDDVNGKDNNYDNKIYGRISVQVRLTTTRMLRRIRLPTMKSVIHVRNHKVMLI